MNQFYASEEYLRDLKEKTVPQLITHLRQRQLLLPTIRCVSCEQPMSEYKNSRSADGVIFRCTTRNCSKKSNTISIRKNSFFANFNFSLKKIVEILHCFSNNENKTQIGLKMNVSSEAIQNIYKKLVLKMREHFILNPIRLGGQGVVCQCDETLLCGKRKYNVGNVVSNQTWVFVIVDTSYKPSRGYATIVEDRTASTLIPIIQNVCLPGTTIHTDQWRAYRSISNSFAHLTVNHKLYFVDPHTGCHTQNVESYNNRLKLNIKKMKGLKKRVLMTILLNLCGVKGIVITISKVF